jgi:hypothetical protein
MTTLELTGLKGHHPLGFLAACGLLRVANPAIDMTLCWKPKRGVDSDFTAHVHTNADATESELRTRLVELVAASASQYLQCLDAYDLKEAEAVLEDYRRNGKKIIQKASTCDGAARTAAEWLCCIGSDVVTREKTTGKKKGKTVIRNSHLLMTSGQQDLLKKKGREPATKLAKRSRRGEVPAKVLQNIEEALFGPWRYEDEDHSLGWDPHLQRLHALRNKAPKDDKTNRSVRAAVFLASQALPLFPCFAVDGKLQTTGFHRDNGDDWFAWPIWCDPISLDTLRSLLAHPFNNDLRRRGVEVVYRCRRVRTGGSEGNYQVFSHAEQRPWPRRKQRLASQPNAASRR